MPNASEAISTGGALTHPTGNEVTVADLAGGNTAIVAATYGGRTVNLYSSAEGAAITFDSGANWTGTKSRLGVIVHPGSRPIAVYNGGTPGTDPVFEGLLVPGAVGRFVNRGTTARGEWAWVGDQFRFKRIPIFKGRAAHVPGTFDTGSTSTAITQSGHYTNNCVMVSSTIVAWTWGDANNDIKVCAAKLNDDGTISVASAATMQSHATDSYSAPAIGVVGSTLVVGWIRNTATASFELGLVTVTDNGNGVAPTLGTPGTPVNDSALADRVGTAFTTCIVDIVADAAGTGFWVIGVSGSIDTTFQFWTFSGTTPTAQASLDVPAQGNGYSYPIGSKSPTANVLFASMARGGAAGTRPSASLLKLTRSGGSISITFEVLLSWKLTPFNDINSSGPLMLAHLNAVEGEAIIVGSMGEPLVAQIFFDTSNGVVKRGYSKRGALLPGNRAMGFNAWSAPAGGRQLIVMNGWVSAVISLDRYINSMPFYASTGLDQQPMFEDPAVGPEPSTSVGDDYTGTLGFAVHQASGRVSVVRSAKRTSGGNLLFVVSAFDLPRVGA